MSGRVPRRLVVAIATIILVALPAGVAAAPFSAKASVAPGVQYLNDTAGTVFTFTVHNTGATSSIGAVQIDRPSNQWTITACPQAPAGWATQRSDAMCRYRSADGTADDIAAGATNSSFQVRATTLPGSADRPGTWGVTVSKSNQFDNKSLLTAAQSEPPGLGVTAYSWQILDAIVDPSPSAPGAACPAATAANHSAITGSTGHTIVICGKNRMTVAGTPLAARSLLVGTFIASAGSFTSASIAANSASSVVLGTWSNVTITSVAGTGKTIIAKTGSAANRTSPLTTLAGYEAKNQPPVAVDDSYATNEDTALNVAIPGVLANDSDPDGDPITAVVGTTTAHGTLTLNANGSFAYTPAPNYNGPDSFTYKARDPFAAESAPATVTINVNPVNDAPLAVNDAYTTNEDTLLAILVGGVLDNDSDLDGDPLSAIVNVDPAHGSLTLGADGSIAYTPDRNFHGTDTFTYHANDGAANSNIATVTITVVSVNDLPIAVNDSYVTDEEASLNVVAPGVLANDTDGDGDLLVATVLSQPAHGVLSLNPDGSLGYTPAANYNGSDSFTYKANDGTVDSSAATVTINVNPVNDAPVAVNDVYTTDEDALLTIPAGGVLLNDTDVDGNPLSTIVNAGPAHGILSLAADGSFTYTPDANFQGTDTFTYHANDGAADSNIATVTITVNSVNDAPVAVGDSYSTSGAASLNVAPPGVLANDTDADGDALTAILVTAPSHAVSFALNPDGSFSYTAEAGSASDTFTYKANDGTADSNVVTVTILVNATPVAAPQNVATDEDTPKTITLSASDTDGPADPAFSIVTPPSHGTLGSLGAVTCDHSSPNTCTVDVVYTPSAGYNGEDAFTFKATDSVAESDPAMVGIAVAAVNDAPTATDKSFSAQANMKITGLTGLLTGAADPDSGDSGYTATLTVGVVSATTPAGGNITNLDPATGTFDFDPPPGATGNVTFTYTVCDTGNPAPPACSAPATVTVTVSGPVIWFVNPAVAGPGDGRLSNPFKSLSANAGAGNDADDVDAANDQIFVYSGAATASMTLQTGEWITGQGAKDATSFDHFMGITPPAGTIARPSLNGAAPTLSGAGITLGSGNNVQGISLSGTTGTAINGAVNVGTLILADIAISNTTTAGLSLTGGGTVSATGTNSIVTTTATALTVANTTIAASGLTFRSISSNGASSGIVLNTTGSSGGLTVTGNGSAGTGGTIASSTGPGISLTSTKSPSFSWMTVQNGASDGISGTTVAGLALSNSMVSGNGNAMGENGLDLAGLTGTAAITSSTITASAENNVSIVNSSGALTFTVTGSTFSNTSTATGNDGIHLDSNNTAGMTVSVTGSTFDHNRGDHFQFATNASASGTNSVTFSSNTLTGDRGSTHSGTDLGGGVTIATDGSSHTTFVIATNNIQGAVDSAIKVDLGTNSTASATLVGSIDGNTIGAAATADSGSAQANGISATAQAAGTATVKISNNNVRQYNLEGINVFTRLGAPTLNATIVGNTVANPAAFAANGILVNAGGQSLDAGQVCAGIGGAGALANSITGAGKNDGLDPTTTDFRVRQRFGTTVKVPGYASAPTDTAAVVNFVKGLNGATPTGTATVQSPGGGFIGGAACPTP